MCGESEKFPSLTVIVYRGGPNGPTLQLNQPPDKGGLLQNKINDLKLFEAGILSSRISIWNECE